MCLITVNNAKIAEKDLYFYKLLNRNLKSPYFYFNYDFNILYKTEITTSKSGTPFDGRDGRYILRMHKKFGDGCLINYNTGFHFVTNYKRIKSLEQNLFKEVFICKIPKGSNYILNGDGLGVADQIVIIRKADTQRYK